MANDQNKPVQPVSGTTVPRYAGPSTFARLPELRDVPRCDVAILGVPFDAGTSYRPGARFGPQAIRQASRHLRTQFHPAYGIEPFMELQVADAGDVACNPFNIAEAIEQIQAAATDLLGNVGGIVSMGGDHTIALPLLRAVNERVGPVALVHSMPISTRGTHISVHRIPTGLSFGGRVKRGCFSTMHRYTLVSEVRCTAAMT